MARRALATPGWKVAAGDVDLHPSIHQARRGQRLLWVFLITEGCAQPHSACGTTGLFPPGKLLGSSVPKFPDLVCGGAQLMPPGMSQMPCASMTCDALFSGDMGR